MTLKLKSMTKRTNAVTVLKATEKQVGKAAMEYAHLFALSIKTGFEEDVSANLAII